MSLADTVNNLYQQTLGRQADPSGLATFTNLLNQGYTEEQVKSALINSPEGQSKGLTAYEYQSGRGNYYDDSTQSSGYEAPYYSNPSTGERKAVDPAAQAPNRSVIDPNTLPIHTGKNFQGTPTQFYDAQGGLKGVLIDMVSAGAGTKEGFMVLDPMSLGLILKPGEKPSVDSAIQQRNEEGQLLFIDPRTGNTTPYNTGVPAETGSTVKDLMYTKPRVHGGQIPKDTQLAMQIAIAIAAPYMMPSILAPVAGAFQAMGLSASAAATAASAVVGAGRGALTSALTGGNVLTGAVTGGVSGGVAPYINSAVSTQLQGVLDKGAADVVAKGVSGALSGAVSGSLSGTGALAGAGKGGLTGALSEILGQSVGGVTPAEDTSGSNVSNENPDAINLIAGGYIDPPEYRFDEFGNILLDAEGKPVPVLDTAKADAAAARENKQTASAARQLGQPLISKTVSSLFGADGARDSTPATSSPATSGARLPSYISSTAPSGYGGAATTGQASTPGQPGSQALAQALRVGDPSDAGTSVDSPSGGTGKKQNVWNTASLRYKDETGSQV
jgi:hypothetical protein